MSDACEQTVSEDICTHLRTIEDDHTSDVICLCCGLVLDKLYLYESNTFFTGECIPDVKFLKIKQFILDVCENMCINRYISDLSFELFKKIYLLEKCSKINHEHLAAYAIYDVLNNENCPRTAQEISYFTNVPLKKIFQIESNILQDNNLSNPENFVERFCSLLNLKYADHKDVRVLMDEISKYVGNIKSACLVATAICIHIKNKQYDIKIKDVCKHCNVSPASIHRSLRVLREKNLYI